LNVKNFLVTEQKMNGIILDGETIEVDSFCHVPRKKRSESARKNAGQAYVIF